MSDPPKSWPVLRFLNEEAPIEKTKNFLPHWQQDARTYFLTFRLYDSIPQTLLEDWRADRNSWLQDNPEPWSLETEKEFHLRFSSAIDHLLDQGHGACVLRESKNSSVVHQAFQHFHGDRYLIHASVVMPNHVHVLLSLSENTSLAKTVASWKRFTAVSINSSMDRSGYFWQRDYFDRLIRDWDHFVNVTRYIRNNPKKARLLEGEYNLFLADCVVKLFS